MYYYSRSCNEAEDSVWVQDLIGTTIIYGLTEVHLTN